MMSSVVKQNSKNDTKIQFSVQIASKLKQTRPWMKFNDHNTKYMYCMKTMHLHHTVRHCFKMCMRILTFKYLKL